jgi:medium-chain acyl-[acyl-carrier-protein] hydrolase
LRETPFTSFGALVKELTDVLQRHSEKPFAIFGHSMGGLIAFELARQLRRKGACGPSHLFISACRPPQIRDCNPHIHAWPDEAFLAELQDRYGPSPSHLVDAELIQLYLPILRADMAVCESYGFARGAPLDTPITVFSGREDRQLKLAQLARWSTHTQSSFTVEIFPGNHFFWHGNSGPMLKSIKRELTQISKSIVGNSFNGK